MTQWEGSLTWSLTENWLGVFKYKNRVLARWCIEDPKSNVHDLSKEPTEIVLRPSMFEEFSGIMGMNQDYRKNLDGKWSDGKGEKQINEAIDGKKT